MLVSLIVPSFNEADDIAETLNSILAIDYADKEIIVVDDSTDNTTDIIREYAEKYHFQLLRQPVRRGLNGAYNLGIKTAKGEIVVLFTADNRPEPDFIKKILPHFQQGADYLVIESNITNTKALFPRLIQAMHVGMYRVKKGFEPLWTEGFSARREALLAVDMFPEHYPVYGGTDNLLPERLRNHGFIKKMDFSIIMPHVAPTRFWEFWRQQVGRGLAGPQYNYAVNGQSFLKISAKVFIKVFLYVVGVLTLLPMLFLSMRYSRYSERRWKDWFLFDYALSLTYLARALGEWRGWKEVFIRKLKRKKV